MYGELRDSFTEFASLVGYRKSVLVLFATERRSGVANTPASYAWTPGFKSLPGTGYPDWGSLLFSLDPRGKWQDSTLN
jgi:hypothetical protein